ncbi:DUF7415 domain-containing protein [Citrobacter koseri]
MKDYLIQTDAYWCAYTLGDSEGDKSAGVISQFAKDTGIMTVLATLDEHVVGLVAELADKLEAAKKRIIELEALAEAESSGADKVARDAIDWMKRCTELEMALAKRELMDNVGCVKPPVINESAILSWSELALRGLVFRINYEVLHPQGLAMMYDPATGISDGALVASDGIWNYSDEIIKSAKQKGWL